MSRTKRAVVADAVARDELEAEVGISRMEPETFWVLKYKAS